MGVADFLDTIIVTDPPVSVGFRYDGEAGT